MEASTGAGKVREQPALVEAMRLRVVEMLLSHSCWPAAADTLAPLTRRPCHCHIPALYFYPRCPSPACPHLPVGT